MSRGTAGPGQCLRWMDLLRFALLHAGIGFGIATLFVAGILWTDPGGLGALLAPARQGLLPLALLWFFSGLTFGSVQIGAAVMLREER